MNKRNTRQTNAMNRAKQFVLDHPITPPNAALTAAGTALTTAITQIEACDGLRLTGKGTAIGTTEERHALRDQLHSAVSDLCRVSKTLDKTAHPDIAAQLKMGRVDSYGALLAYANNVITVVTPMKDVFIAHGSATTVIEDLQALIDAFANATGRHYTALGVQTNKTVALRNAIRDGMNRVRVLDGILSQLLKSDEPLLAEWKSAKRVQQAPQHQQAASGQSASSGSDQSAPSGGDNTGTGSDGQTTTQ
jgi:hypothetical protein